MKNKPIPFVRSHLTGQEIKYVADAIKSGKIGGNGSYTHLCEALIEKQTQSKKIFLTPSCTAALELAAILVDIKESDEVIMPSFTFTSTANAFILQGAKPVFVDIDPETLNISTHEIKKAITKKTRAIVPVHYAGVACNMEAIMDFKNKHTYVIEDAAQGYGSFYKKQHLGTLGDIGTFSFHETKNISSGEGGAISINNKKLIERAEIIREKGTNRNKFLLGLVDKYTWCDIGTSCLPSEINAAYLLAQIEASRKINQERIAIWQRYHTMLNQAESDKKLLRPQIPSYATHNGHIYYVILKNKKIRDLCIAHMKKHFITTPFHYVPLHSSPAGKKYGKKVGTMRYTNELSERLLRLPLWPDLKNTEIQLITDTLLNFLYDNKN
jgi:dTDP-4-amino-4,6-dideoxygalactose transaminase